MNGAEASRGGLVSARKAAAAIGVHLRTVQRWIHRGELAAIKKSGRWYVRRKTLERLLEPGDT